MLGQLKALGVHVSIDDFGSGYSSLLFLRQFQVDSLKIDRSFITRISQSAESPALIHTLIQLGKALGIETLAEGVEDDTQLARLQREQCDSAQGFLLARPLGADEIAEFFSRPSTEGTPPDVVVPSGSKA
jgi:EAL domain-containing protein (putative c-di-GMP-specific phosphodiesterase class I)